MKTRAPGGAPFKVCPNCRAKWRSRDAFLSEPSLSLVGYQVNYGDLHAGLFLFNHDTADCGTTMAVEAGKFTDMHEGPIFQSRLAHTDKCAGHCLRESDLGPCPNECECAYVRDVIQQVKKRLARVRAAFQARANADAKGTGAGHNSQGPR